MRNETPHPNPCCASKRGRVRFHRTPICPFRAGLHGISPAIWLSCVLIALLLSNPTQCAERPIDLQHAIIFIAPGSTGPEKKAAVMLAEEVDKRTGVRWPISDAWPADSM